MRPVTGRLLERIVSVVKPVREIYGIVHSEPAQMLDTYGGTSGVVFFECVRVRRLDIESKTVVVFSHPVGGGAFLPMVTALAAAGIHVIYCNPRFRGNDSALIMEKCLLDLGACLRDQKGRFGYEKVILGGWSGGGSLSLFYQDQAENPTIKTTPAGDPMDLSLVDLPKADGILLLAAHVSRAVTMTEWLDPSITDENAPFDRDPALNLYDPTNPNQPPYTDEFVARFRAAQIARNRRITAQAKDTLAQLKANPDGPPERPFMVHGTMADVRWLDPTQDPSDRPPGTCYMGDPKVVNDGPVGLARFTTTRSWLSQWSYDESNADGTGNASRVSCPVLVINNTADLACTPSHAERLFGAISHSDKEMHQVKDADHYYSLKPEKVHDAVNLVTDWLSRKGFSDLPA